MSTVFSWLGNHPKTTFVTRLILWALLSCVLPFVLIAYRFKLFNKVSQVSLSGWGMIGIIILAVFVLTVVKYVKMALKARYSLFGQCLGGVCKIIIPLLAVYLIAYVIKDDLQSFIDVMGLVIIFETVAIPLNPLPQWAYEMQKNVDAEERKETFDYCLDKFFARKEQEGKE